jgi:WD40 repeat protein
VTQLFDLEQKKEVATFDSPDGRGGHVAISPDGTVLVQGAQEGVRVWKLPTKADSN